ncbi:MAG: pantoate kinase [Candidatus Heimdallarchaeota archaeon]
MPYMSSNTWVVPAHITGLFQIHPHDDPLKMGSCGAGFSIDNPVLTIAQYKESPTDEVEILYNNQIIDGIVSLNVFKEFKEFTKGKRVFIQHYSKLPMQAGFGSSGAGSLGAAFSLNELFSATKSREELSQIAHVAEVNCKSGLGDVIAQMHAGGEIRVEPGAPGIGQVKKLDWPDEYKILSIYLGKMSTKKIITNVEHIKKINEASSNLLIELEKEPTVEKFVEVSYQFAKETQLMNERVEKLVTELRKKKYKASMIMLGESIFVVGKYNKLQNCKEELKINYPQAKTWLDNLAVQGPQFIKEEENEEQ